MKTEFLRGSIQLKGFLRGSQGDPTRMWWIYLLVLLLVTITMKLGRVNFKIYRADRESRAEAKVDLRANTEAQLKKWIQHIESLLTISLEWKWERRLKLRDTQENQAKIGTSTSQLWLRGKNLKCLTEPREWLIWRAWTFFNKKLEGEVPLLLWEKRRLRAERSPNRTKAITFCCII